ncbi:LysM peptidoglycan-binding domain-containing protein [Puniceicoccaceae bacterium K14]|nr:LysM peptidoglycan-binding domain-containing protein [Puniceicoccaceae bacterium K14]
MDHLSSTDLDSPSKTPLFLGIAALILAIAAVVLAWLGFTKVTALEAQLSELSSGNDSIAAIEGEVAKNSDQLKQVISGVTGMREEVNKALGGIQDDISSNKKNIRGVTIQAGTALKKVRELEAKGVQVVAAPVEAPRVSTSPKDNPEIDVTKAPKESTPLEGREPETQRYRIKSGDYLSKVAARFKISLNDILKANPGIDPNRLAIGQEIVIPSAE